MKTFSIFSLGLIGGSIARAIREYIPDSRIYIYARRQETIDEAMEAGVCDEGFTSIEPKLCQADLIFLCAPVSVNARMLEQMKPYLGEHSIITDVGSVKTDIHNHVTALGLDSRFIGGHPMAGSEKTGFANSSVRLLENAYYILTPGEGVPHETVEEYENLVRKMGAIPVVLSHKEHDFATAGISHLPHVIAYSLVNLIREQDADKGIMKMLAAGGFRDITRIASSSPEMWEQICMTNTDNIVTLLDAYQDILSDMRSKLLASDHTGLHDSFQRAKNYRDSFAERNGLLKPSYHFHVDVADVPGSIAHIATILALHQISIKNIGIVNNREYEEGALRVEFYDQESMLHAKELLTKNEITIFEAK